VRAALTEPLYNTELTYRQIILDVQPTLLPDEELADLAAAEQVVTNKENQRAIIVDKLQEELKREFPLGLAAWIPRPRSSMGGSSAHLRTDAAI